MLKDEIKEFPQNPGVYLMKKKDKIIYIGKAKNLKKRVSSYFNKNHDDKKTRKLVKTVEKIDYIICNSEIDALILENNLIKKHKPRFNILLKDQKTYPYIKITKEKFPKLTIIRSTKQLDLSKGYYFGPYPHGVYNFIKILKRIFMIRDCNRDMGRVYDRACLKYYMGMCSGPCVYKDIEESYGENIKKIIAFLRGNVGDIIKDYTLKMNEHSQNMEFELAISYRNKIDEIKKIAENRVAELSKAIDEDVFTMKIENNLLFICVLTVREGKILGKNSININIEDSNEEDIFVNTIIQYYEKHALPGNLIIDSFYKDFEELIIMWADKVKNKKLNIFLPLIKSRRYELLTMGNLNLEKDIEKYFQKKHVLEQGLFHLYKTMNLNNYPTRIECFDISNIQGKDAVASMSVAINGKTTNSEYRKFIITCKDTPDDFAMLREVMIRRYSKLEKKDRPDLILIDGGKGQLNGCGAILDSLNCLPDIDLISIAKREEEIFKFGESDPYIFNKSGETIKILQRLRDEAHRFGITFHRKKRSQRVIKSELDDIKGIGKKRKELLLKKFKTVSNIKNASIDELTEIIPENVAIELREKLKADK